MERRRVVVTGMGAVTPVGHTVDATWDALVAGRNGIGCVTRFDTTGYSSRLAAEIKGFDPAVHLDGRTARRSDPFIQYAIVAARQAVRQAGLVVDETNRERIGVVFGSGIGGVNAWGDGVRTLLERGPGRVSPLLIPMLIGNMAAGMVSIDLGARGPNKSIQTACATSAHCIGDAVRLIQYGDCDVVVAGGSEAAVEPIAYAGFCSMKAFSTRNNDPEHACRPFDQGRDGFIMAEGSAALVLETWEHAMARGAEPLAEVAGYGQSADAYHMAAPLPNGDGAAAAMRAALADAGLTAADLGYINAHATSTPAGDVSEVNAIRQLYGCERPPVAISSTKSMTGHLLGAAGALEMIVCIQAIRQGILPPTINYTEPDPACSVDCVPNEARAARVRAAMSNSFGFGGHNCSLVATAI
jgi:3-oxoacyl-[acyl-carrier-protein] synthase II